MDCLSLPMGKPVGTRIAEDEPSSRAGTDSDVTPGVVFSGKKGNHPSRQTVSEADKSKDFNKDYCIARNNFMVEIKFDSYAQNHHCND